MSLLGSILAALLGIFGYRVVTVSSLARTKGGNKPVPGLSVTLTYQKSGSTANTDGTSITKSTGTCSNSVYLRAGTYRMTVSEPGSSGYGPASYSLSVTVP